MTRKVLIIEDDELLNRLVVRCVSQLGHDVTGTRSWKEAAAYLEQHEPHLVIMDVRLPDGDSLTHLRRLVERQPVIVLTAYGSVQHAVEAMKAGASEYLVKPVSPEELNLVV